MESGGTETFPQGQKGETRNIVGDQSGFGSGKQFEKAKYISENATEETILNFRKQNNTLFVAVVIGFE